nr:putative late blight resistance protein homolog R1B-17 isoform X1 [Coffea arabica]XP_027127500.1 putative late blight resistance protein homolog R1B-17 isoform X1 [Coffea arabica]XP_027127501.1 putative late blight resistance protein homolog R1B-17 isoform X1 [Coffea arabica]
MEITPEIVVGFDNEAKALINRLIRGSQLEIIPIVGMPGLGKTTLAKKVYNTLSSQRQFHIQLWCTVSQAYSVKDLLLQLLCSDGEHSRKNEELRNLDEEELLDKLRKKLLGNKYLVVFDDVWDDRVWNDLRLSFQGATKGSKILLTSRNSNVASQIEYGGEPHNLRLLTDTLSWELLQKKVFGEKECPEGLVKIGKQIAKNCKGLPFSVVIISGILATKEYERWDEVAVYDTDECMNILELSYTHLPPYLKPCLLYFGAFREDQEIQSKKLMQLWIAEGFVQCTDAKRLEHLAEEYMMDLIGRNLVMVAKHRSIGGVRACHIHDLLHKYCMVKAKEENFLQVLHGYDELSTFTEPPNLSRLSVWSKVEHFKESRLFCPQLSTLLFINLIRNDSESFLADASFVFQIYKGLRVLDIEQIVLRHKVFPSEVVSLVELRYLAMQGEMRVIPPSVAKLSNLETFRVISDYGIVSLPNTLWSMTKLRHLHIEGYDLVWSLPRENLENNSGLLNLDTFSTLRVSLDQRVENILKNIPHVRQLKIKLSKAKKSTTIGYCNMSGLESLESLEVWATSLPPDRVEFSFPSTLKKLVLIGLNLPWSKISLIEELPNLEVLKLLYHSFKGERWVLTEGGFRKLRFLDLENLDVVEWTDTDPDDHFPRLQKLLMSGLSKLELMPSCLAQISALELIEFRSCKASVKDLVQKIEEEQKDCGNEDLRIIP